MLMVNVQDVALDALLCVRSLQLQRCKPIIV